jgi:hypothetical protein
MHEENRFLQLCQQGKLDEAKLLVRERNPNLMQLLKDKNFEIAQWLVKIKHDIDWEDVFAKACLARDIEIVKSIVDIHPTIRLDEEAFVKVCIGGSLEIAQWLLEKNPTINISAFNERAFIVAAHHGYFHMVKWLLLQKPSIDISISNDLVFRGACENGDLEIAQYLFHLKPTMDISFANEHAFVQACQNGHLHVMAWLLQVKPDIDISADNHYLFKFACNHNYVRLAQILCDHHQHYSIQTQGDIICKWDIDQPLLCLGEVFENKNEEDCCVCLEVTDAKLPCRHFVCKSCLHQLRGKNSCPYCRAGFIGYYKINR